MITERNVYKRFDEPPADLDRMSCCINAMIEVFGLNISKLKKVNLEMITEAVKKIERYNFTFSPAGAVL